jgi:hypothetical protein
MKFSIFSIVFASFGSFRCQSLMFALTVTFFGSFSFWRSIS